MKEAGNGRLLVLDLTWSHSPFWLAGALSQHRYASIFIFIFFGKIKLALCTDGKASGTCGHNFQPKASQSLSPRDVCSASAPTAAKAASQSLASNTASMAATTTWSHCIVVTEPAAEAALRRRHISLKADLNLANKCVSHGCNSAVISAGM